MPINESLNFTSRRDTYVTYEKVSTHQVFFQSIISRFPEIDFPIRPQTSSLRSSHDHVQMLQPAEIRKTCSQQMFHE